MDVVHELYTHPLARVVVIFLEYQHQEDLYGAVIHQDLVGHFIFVGGEEMTGKTLGQYILPSLNNI